MESLDPSQIQFALNWIADPTESPAPVNQILISGGPGIESTNRADLYYVRFGHVNPPLIMPGTDVEVVSEIAQTPLPITSQGYFLVSKDRLEEFRNVINNVLNENADI